MGRGSLFSLKFNGTPTRVCMKWVDFQIRMRFAGLRSPQMFIAETFGACVCVLRKGPASNAADAETPRFFRLPVQEKGKKWEAGNGRTTFGA